MTTKLATLQLFEVVLWGEDKNVPLWRAGCRSFTEDEAKDDILKAYQRQSRIPVKRIEVLSDVHLDTGRRQQTLFEDLGELCLGHSMTDIQGAAVNLLLAGVQRASTDLASAERRWDELMGRGKEALRRRYARKLGTSRDDLTAGEQEIANRLIG